jgi:6-phosphogluconolactonase
MRFRRLAGGAAAAGMVLALTVPGLVAAHDESGGFVYAESNASAGNSILAFARGAGGVLSPIGTFATGGLGTGADPAAQGAVVLARGGRWLLAVNSGSNDVSVFRVGAKGRLYLADRIGAGGTDPISVTAHLPYVYVLDAGGSGNIAGFWMSPLGRLYPIPGSIRSLSGPATNPAEIAFSTNGRFLVVTERDTNEIDTYPVGFAGRAGHAVTTASSGPVPYGFAFDLRNHPIVSEAANSTLSSYRLSASGASVISASVPTGGLAACWVAVTPNGRFAFDTNAHGGTISSFSIAHSGAIALVQSVAASTGAGTAPLDLGVSSNGRFLYVREAGVSAIATYRVGPGANLSQVPGTVTLPAGATGLAAS